MKTLVIVLVLFLCEQTFAQHLNMNDETKLPPLILLKYPNIKDTFSNSLITKYDLNTTIPFLEIYNAQNTNFFIDMRRRANRNFTFSQPQEINLNKELQKIMHRFLGDGSNLVLCPRGLLVP